MGAGGWREDPLQGGGPASSLYPCCCPHHRWCPAPSPPHPPPTPTTPTTPPPPHSRWASSVSIYNRILEKRPDLIEVGGRLDTTRGAMAHAALNGGVGCPPCALCCCTTALLLHYCTAAALLHCCCTTALLLHYCTAAALLHCCCTTALLLHYCTAAALLHKHLMAVAHECLPEQLARPPALQPMN